MPEDGMYVITLFSYTLCHSQQLFVIDSMWGRLERVWWNTEQLAVVCYNIEVKQHRQQCNPGPG
jgi:hypothetical protein